MPTANPRILLVEDEQLLRESIGEALTTSGFTVATRPDGRGFGEQLASFRPDLVLLDVMLPGPANGISLAREVRRSTTAPVVFLTARDAVSDRLDGFDAGADDYVVKPFVLAELIARLRAVLRRSGRLVSSTIEVGPLVVDEGAGIVLLDGAPVVLTATEFRLVGYLARNRDRVLSKTQILTQVWGYDDYDPNLVETFVSGVRRKLTAVDPDAARLIQTVRGLGYRLAAVAA